MKKWYWYSLIAVIAVLVFLGPVRSAAMKLIAAPDELALTATKTDALAAGGDVDLDGNLDPGDTLQYTIVVAATGGDATGVAFDDNLGADLTFVPGSLLASPLANADSYAVLGNVRIQVSAANGVLANDFMGVPGATITAADTTSANGGAVSVNLADGSFAYNPPPGFEGTDTFSYTLTNSVGSDVGTVTLTVDGMIWFVDATAGPGGNGRLTEPHSCLVGTDCFDDNILDEAGDTIFLYSGAHTGGHTLLNSQKLIGQWATADLATLAGVTVPPFSDTLPSTSGTSPTVTASGTNITLGSGNTVRGLTLTNSGGTGLLGASVGNLTVAEVAVTTTGGVAVNLDNGALNASFTSISASGGSNGIILTNTTATGSPGGFIIDGDGTDTSVGGNSSGGIISTMSGADGATEGNGVFLSNASGVTLRRMTINGTNQNHGIRGVNASNFTLEYSTVSGDNGTSTALDEGSVNFDNLTGSASITSSVIEGGLKENLNVVNTSGTLNRLTITGSTFGFNNTANGNNNILIESQNAGTTLNFTLQSSTIKGARADWLNASANSSSTMDAVIGGSTIALGNTFDNLGANAHPGAATGGNRLVTSSVGNQTVDIRNNTLQGAKGEAIRVRGTASGATTGTVNGRVRNNTIGVAATANSGSSEGSGIFALGDGGSDMTIAITDNQVFQYNNHGILLQFGDELNDGSVFNITVTGNSVNTPGTLLDNFNAIHLNNGTVGATDNFTTCADIGGAGGLMNIVTGGGKGATSPNNNDIRLRQRQATSVRLPGYSGANNDNTAVQDYLATRNTLTTVNAANAVPTGGGYVGGAACTQPSNKMADPDPKASDKPDTTSGSSATLETAAPMSLFAQVAALANDLFGVGSAQAHTTDGSGIRPSSAALRPASDSVPTVNIGALASGKSVTIKFQVQLSPTFMGSQVCNQGTVTGSNFTAVQTNDPDTLAAGDATCTTVQQPPTATPTPTALPVTVTPTATVNPNAPVLPAQCPGPINHYTIILGTAAGQTLNGTAGDDFIVGNGGNDVINGNGGNDCILAGNGGDIITTLGGDDVILAGGGNNTIHAGDGKNTIISGAGGDSITTGSGNDTIDDSGGNNTINAGGGHNKVNTGGGGDTITTGSGNDTIDAGSGNNTIQAGDGDNDITAGDGGDQITTGTGMDIIHAGGGNNTITTGNGNKTITAGNGSDTITTGSGNDTITAGSGNNNINAGAGDDTVTAGAGNDTIDGGPGTDSCNADGGANTLINCNP